MDDITIKPHKKIRYAENPFLHNIVLVINKTEYALDTSTIKTNDSLTSDYETLATHDYSPDRLSPQEWLRLQQLKIVLGGVAVGIVADANNLEYVRHDVIETAPWLDGTILASEIALVAVAIVVAKIGYNKRGGPFKHRKEKVQEITQYADKKLDKLVNNATEAPTHESKKLSRAKVRRATTSDLDRLAEIDLSRYKRVYGEDPPAKEEILAMLQSRLENATSEWMYVCEVDGIVEGFISGFTTNKSMEDTVSWEDTTADGTLDGCVDKDGKYVYGANLTANPKAVERDGDAMLLAHLIAQAIEVGAEYGYFMARMPLFSAWIKRQARRGTVDPEQVSSDAQYLDELALQYVNLTEEIEGKTVSVDYELRMYEEAGFERGRVVREGFSDPLSMNYGVLFKVNIPPQNPRLKQSKTARKLVASSIRQLAKNPVLLEKALS